MSEPCDPENHINRREVLWCLGSTGLAVELGKFSLNAGEIELNAGEIDPIITGYTDSLSVEAGEDIGFHISTTLKKYSIEIFRVGAKKESVWTRRGLPGIRYPFPENAYSHGCDWPLALRVSVPREWRSGYYSVLLRGEDSAGRSATGEMFFVVRSARPGKESRILLQLTTNTYNAYNTWGGMSLYGNPRAKRVSFDRPWAGFADPDGFTATYSGWRNWEEPFVQWAEQAGYSLDYAVNSDLEFHPELLEHYRLVLSVGHDEYWSSPMRDHLETFIAEGGNVAFFSGNTAFWQVRSESMGRALVCWKQDYTEDPFHRSGRHGLLATMWCHRLVGRPENQLTGVGWAYGGYHRFFEQFPDGAGGYTIHRPEHWIFEGTGLKRGDLLGTKHSIVGYECDGCQFEMKNGVPVPTHRDGTPETFEILGTAPAGLSIQDDSIGIVADGLYDEGSGRSHPQPGAAVLGSYTRGGTVVTSGCTNWPHGLRGGDEIVERITRNILDRLSG